MYYKNDFLQKLQRKLGKFAIKNLMLYIVGTMAAVFAFSIVMPEVNLVSLLWFDQNAVMQGEVWRVITFIFIPPNFSIIFIVFALYLYWMIGRTLEGQWGAFRFNMFYLCGILGSIAAGFITGFATNTYLNLSLFLAFALLFPNFELRLFFILPVKMKWLALLNVAFLVYDFIISPWQLRAALIASVINIILFFGKDLVILLNNKRRRAQWKRDMRR
ncbi:MAG: hypothetical protein FWE34_09580 [Defluviitaleaceae bacterium]|nr:hypothetical protein [Defluviitaleaceae bacterium]